MPRLLFVFIVFASCCFAVADEKSPPKTATKYTATIEFVKVEQGKQVIAVDTKVIGTKGTPLKVDLGGRDGLALKLEIQDLQGATPSQYLAQFRLIEKGKVLSAPTITTTVERPAKLFVGQEKGDRIEVDLTVKEDAERK